MKYVSAKLEKVAVLLLDGNMMLGWTKIGTKKAIGFSIGVDSPPRPRAHRHFLNDAVAFENLPSSFLGSHFMARC